MASHHLTIAKASFVAACLRPDVTKVSRDDINVFHNLVAAAVHKCSPSNLQKCREWLVDNVLPSPHRTGALGKFLASLVKYLPTNEGLPTQARPPLRRQRLHVLYLINDLLHHAKYHSRGTNVLVNLVAGLAPTLLEIFQLTATDNKPRIKKRLQDLLAIWDHHGYLDTSVIEDIIKVVVRGEAVVSVDKTSGPASPVRELPFVLPATHGDPSAPFYDLPAANLMPYIVPNMSTPMRPDQITALRLKPGLADQSLVAAVKSLLKDAKRLEQPFSQLEDEGIMADMDEMGQFSYKNDDDRSVSDTYYGWSREFCDKMRKRGQSGHNSIRDSRSPSSDRSEGKIAHKRRRHHSDRSRSRSSSFSPERMPSEHYPFDTRQHAGDRHANFSGFTQHGNEDNKLPTAAPNGRPHHHNVLRPPPPAGSIVPPIPPPRPPNWNGPWPPPPPPLPFIPGSGFPNMPFPPAPPF